MRLIKSQNMGFLQRTYGHGQTFYYVASPIVFFDLESNQILMENQQWLKVAQALPGDALDHGLPKTCGEFLLAGHAYPHEDDADVIYPTIKVGKKQKQLKVSGKRQWQKTILRSTCPTEPEIIAQPVSLDWNNAYGGEGYAANPLGTGYVKTTPPPCVEKEGYVAERPGKKTQAASFLPMQMTWPQRSKYQGKYKKDWFDKYFPAFSPSTDLKLFNCVSDDQHLKGYFNGDETYNLSQLHPKHREFEGRLPGIKARAFVNYQQTLTELPLNLDTVWFMPTVGIGALIFRGQIAVANTEALEITDVLLGYESLNDEPKSQQHYQQVFELRTNKDTALANVMNEAQLAPATSAQQQSEKQQKVAQQRERKVGEIKDYQQKMLKRFPPSIVASGQLPQPELTPADDILEEDVKSGNVDLAPLLAHADAKTEQANKQSEERLAELTAKFPQQANTNSEQQELDIAQVKQNLQVVHGQDSLEQQALLSQQLTITPTQQVTMSAEASSELRKVVESTVAAGQSLSCKNLTGSDLSSMRFSNIDLSSAILSHANLQHCVFENCNLSATALVNANLNHAQFINCSVDSIQLSGAKGHKVSFNNCKLTNLLWRYTKLTNLELNNCELTACTLLHCEFLHSKLTKCVAEKSTITQCSWLDSDFADCKFGQVIFSECNLQMSRWQACQVERVVMQLCTMQLTILEQVVSHKWVMSTEVDLRCSTWLNCQFDSTSFRNITAIKTRVYNCELINCDLSLANFNISQFIHSKLLQCIAAETRLISSLFNTCNLYKSRFRSALLLQARLRECNLLDADLMWAQLIKTQFIKCKNFSKVAERDLKRRDSQQQEVSDDQIRITGTA